MEGYNFGEENPGLSLMENKVVSHVWLHPSLRIEAYGYTAHCGRQSLST